MGEIDREKREIEGGRVEFVGQGTREGESAVRCKKLERIWIDMVLFLTLTAPYLQCQSPIHLD